MAIFNRRLTVRHLVLEELPVSIEADGQLLATARLHDISTMGMGLRIEPDQYVSEVNVELGLTLPGQPRSIRVPAIIEGYIENPGRTRR